MKPSIKKTILTTGRIASSGSSFLVTLLLSIQMTNSEFISVQSFLATTGLISVAVTFGLDEWIRSTRLKDDAINHLVVGWFSVYFSFALMMLLFHIVWGGTKFYCVYFVIAAIGISANNCLFWMTSRFGQQVKALILFLFVPNSLLLISVTFFDLSPSYFMYVFCAVWCVVPLYFLLRNAFTNGRSLVKLSIFTGAKTRGVMFVNSSIAVAGIMLPILLITRMEASPEVVLFVVLYRFFRFTGPLSALALQINLPKLLDDDSRHLRSEIRLYFEVGVFNIGFALLFLVPFLIFWMLTPNIYDIPIGSSWQFGGPLAIAAVLSITSSHGTQMLFRNDLKFGALFSSSAYLLVMIIVSHTFGISLITLSLGVLTAVCVGIFITSVSLSIFQKS